MDSLLPYTHARSKGPTTAWVEQRRVLVPRRLRTDFGASQPLAAIDPNHQTRNVRSSSRYLYLSDPQLRYIEYHLR